MPVVAAAAVNAARCRAGTPTIDEKSSATGSLVNEEETSKAEHRRTLPKGTVPGQISAVS